MKIEQSTFLITGGGSGLGAATAQLLAESGANVVVADINRDAGEAVAAAIGAARARFVGTNVTSEESVAEAITAARESFGRLDGAINCAGVGLAERLVGKRGPHGLAAFTRVIQVNLIGTFNVIRLAAAEMAAQEPGPGGERGVIINTASIAAFDGQIGQAAYAASKGGIVGLTLPAARDLARHAIRVVTIAPGSSTPRCWARSPSRSVRRSARRCLSRRASATRGTSPRSPATSSRTKCSTARSSVWTARCACRHSDSGASPPS